MRNHTRQLKQWLLAVLLAALALLPQPAYASGIATDDLRIRVGYFGMSTDEYVDVDTYHWSQLESDLPLAQQAYSFLRVGEDGTYQVIVDSARGFYIDDLLEYANINISDIQSMNFYTRDQETGYFTSFSLAELLQSRRYYFDDLPAHLYPIYDEEGNFTGQYDDTEAWQYAVEVRPMLALEDNWVRYEVGTEHTGPDYSAMGTANRFRLLFGQTSPMESRTNQTAKYVYAVNVTLDGQPEVVREMQPLEGTVGSHKTTMTLSVGNLSILKNLQQLLKFDSSDGGVLRIDSWTVTPDSTYSDLVTVEISYTILKEGTASISGNMGGLGAERGGLGGGAAGGAAPRGGAAGGGTRPGDHRRREQRHRRGGGAVPERRTAPDDPPVGGDERPAGAAGQQPGTAGGDAPESGGFCPHGGAGG